MRIALVIQQPQARGQELFACTLGNFLLDQDHEVILISLFQGDFPLSFKGKHVSLNWEVKQKWIGISRFKSLSTELRKFNPDIVQANGGDTLKYSVLSAMIFPFSGKVIFNNGGVVSYYFRSGLQKFFYRFLLNRLQGLISISSYSAQDLNGLLDASIPKCQIPIGLNTNFQFALKEAAPNPVFVHIGGFTPEKNHRFLIALWENYQSIIPESMLVLIGGGPQKSEIEQLIDSKSLSNIHLLGSQVNPWAFVPKNAILLLPSKIEGMPSVIAESILSGIPVIAHRVGGIAEMVEALPACFLPEFENIENWSQAMNYWVSMAEEEKSNLLASSREMVVAKFDMQVVGEQFQKFHKSL
ncbi:glycosyltransferase family 4 protein [Algoriphagus vanfongensis]|uniref:glycosyltransferase family 4 protein n=1 Tax=Algoriphagus vanfongensis TaxID=426371 RepID=UPI0003FC2DE9|nr:glycosyltransferase family 4 protein [Algoriphagus vanfongensis]